jgi:O-Antigen ligase
MTPSISAAIFAIGSQLFGFAILRAASIPAHGPLIVWIAAAVLLFGLQDPLAVLLLLAVVAIAAAPSLPAERAAFYLAVVPCLPIYVQADLPFPGINFLAVLSFERIATVGILLPILFYARPGAPVRFKWVDLSLFAYAVYISVMVGNALNITSGLRFFADNIILLLIPYIALSRAITTREDLDTCFKGFLVAATILASVTLAATIKQWDFYRLLEPASVFTIPDYRGNLLRIAVTASTASLGYCLVGGLILLEYLRLKLRLGLAPLLVWRALFVFGVFATGSRGAFGALLVAGGIYAVLSIRNRALKALMMSGFAAAAMMAAVWLFTGDHSEVDPYGTFDYRQQLLSTSIEYIRDHLVFGDLDFLNSSHFAHLVQGQGIIDITNFYLQVALNFGMLGFTLFFSVMAWTVLVLLRGSLRASPDGNPCVAMLALVVGWLVLAATTSDVGLTLYLGIALAALGRATCALTTAASEVAVPNALTSAP